MCAQARKHTQNGHGADRSQFLTKSENGPRNNGSSNPVPKPTVTATRPPPEPTLKVVKEEDKQALTSLISQETAEKLIDLDTKIQSKKQVSLDERSIVFDPIMDRARRGAVHQVRV